MTRRRARLSLALAFAASGLGAFAGCGGTGRPAAPPKAAQKSPAAKEARSTDRYALEGVVRQVNPETGLVTIRHKAIPGFMSEMTMPFTVKDRASLEDVRPGDEVEGSLLVTRAGGEVSEYELSGLVVTRPATADVRAGGPGPAGVGAPTERLKPGDPVPDFAMTTQDGRALRLSDLRGKVVVLTFIYTRCPLPDFCPRMDRKFAELADRVGAKSGRAGKVRLLSVSFDPENDTPEVLKKHADGRGARPPLWTFAAASHEELAKAGPGLGLRYGPSRGEVVHNLTVAVVGPDGRLVRAEAGGAARDWPAADLLRAVYSALPDANG